jgi:hypothetical protein
MQALLTEEGIVLCLHLYVVQIFLKERYGPLLISVAVLVFSQHVWKRVIFAPICDNISSVVAAGLS